MPILSERFLLFFFFGDTVSLCKIPQVLELQPSLSALQTSRGLPREINKKILNGATDSAEKYLKTRRDVYGSVRIMVTSDPTGCRGSGCMPCVALGSQARLICLSGVSTCSWFVGLGDDAGCGEGGPGPYLTHSSL